MSSKLLANGNGNKRPSFTADGVLRNIGLVAILLLGLSLAIYGYFDKATYFLPTWDNSMLHAGRAVYILQTGHYAEMELVFGGVTRTYHLPAFPALVAGTSMLTGLDFAWTERLIVLIFSVLLPFAFYKLAKELSGDWRAGVAAATIALFSANLMTWATRNSPIGFGNILVPFGLYLVYKKKTFAAVLCALAVALDHPPSLLVFTVSVFLFFLYEYFSEISKNAISAGNVLRSLVGADVITATLSGLITFATYYAWHIRQTGLSCLTFKCLPQAAAREFGKSIDLFDYFATNPHFYAIIGVIAIAADGKMPNRAKAMMLAYVLGCIILVKNDALGVGTFTERFLTYQDGAVAVLGGIGIAFVLSMLEKFSNSAAASSS